MSAAVSRFLTLRETSDPILRWQVWSNICNENAGFKPDYYIAGFQHKESALRYLEERQ